MNESLPVVAILGGSGALGSGLARRWAQAGYRIIIGSRTQQKAAQAVADLLASLQRFGVNTPDIAAMENLAAAQSADIVALTVPFSHQKATLESVKPALRGKILIDATVPLAPPKVARVQLPAEGSAGKIAQQLLGEETDVVSAFQNVAARHLQEAHDLAGDVIVCGDKKAAREQVIRLVEAAGMRGLHGGGIDNAAAVEALTSVLIFINKQYQCRAGIRITGIGDEAQSV